jgi:chromosome segregation ATPase
MLNEEDLRQIQAIITALKTDIKTDITASAAALKTDLIARQDRAVEAIAAEISALRTELAARMDTLERRFETIAPTILGTSAQISVLTRGLDQLLALHGKTTGDQAAIQRAVDQLTARVAKLEREIHPEQ